MAEEDWQYHQPQKDCDSPAKPARPGSERNPAGNAHRFLLPKLRNLPVAIHGRPPRWQNGFIVRQNMVSRSSRRSFMKLQRSRNISAFTTECGGREGAICQRPESRGRTAQTGGQRSAKRWDKPDLSTLRVIVPTFELVSRPPSISHPPNGLD